MGTTRMVTVSVTVIAVTEAPAEVSIGVGEATAGMATIYF